jgi:WD40 repeat protein
VANPASYKPLSRLPVARNQQVNSLIYSPDGHTIAELEISIQTGTNSVQLWNVANPEHPKLLGHPLTSADPGDLSSIAFDSNGRTLAVGGNGTIQLWQISNSEHLRSGPEIVTGGSSVVTMAFSPDGRILAIDDYDGTLQLWNTANPSTQVPVGSAKSNIASTYPQSSKLIYNPNGRVLTLLTGKGDVELWSVGDPSKPNRVRRLPAMATGSVTSIALSAQGTLVTDDVDGAIQLWTSANPENPRPVGQPIASNSFITSVAFSPDGTMAGSTSAGTIFLWNLNVNDAIKRICAAAGNNLTSQNWRHYIPQLPYQAPCRQ